jgi:hypothetical protein
VWGRRGVGPGLQRPATAVLFVGVVHHDLAQRRIARADQRVDRLDGVLLRRVLAVDPLAVVAVHPLRDGLRLLYGVVLHRAAERPPDQQDQRHPGDHQRQRDHRRGRQRGRHPQPVRARSHRGQAMRTA